MNITISQKVALEIFRGINARGFSDSACGCRHSDCGCDINGLTTALGALVLCSSNDGDVAAYHCAATELLHIVGDDNGPRLVTIRAHLMAE